MFRSILLSALMLATFVAAQLTVEQVVTNIQKVTVVSSDINTALSQVTTTTTSTQVVTISRVRMTMLSYIVLITCAFQTVATDFGTIISSLADDVTAMNQTPAFSDADATPIVDALNEVSH
jgi:hypothetical protein